MPKLIETALKIKDLLLPISAIIVTVLNLWLFSKLSPITQSVAANEQSIQALHDIVTVDIKNIKEDVGSLKEDVGSIDNRVDDIYKILVR